MSDFRLILTVATTVLFISCADGLTEIKSGWLSLSAKCHKPGGKNQRNRAKKIKK